MLENLWLTGVLVAFSVFGVKVGLGLGSQLYNVTATRGRKVVMVTGTLLAYSLLFFCIYYVITNFNLLNYLQQFMDVVKYGMVLHLIVAAGLLVWGIKLLISKQSEEQGDSCKACWLLIMPCPVCGVSIFLNLTFAYSFSTLSTWMTTLIMYGIFTAVIFITIAVIFPFRFKIMRGRSFLGTSMSLVSLYFFITVIIAPIYPKVKDVFAMARSNAPIDQNVNSYTWIFAVAVLLLIGLGYLKNRYFIKGLPE